MLFNNIETERLILKNICVEDREFIYKQFSDEEVNKYLYDAEPLNNLDEADGIINFYLQPEPREQHRWIVVLKQNNVKIGTCGFHCWNKQNNSVETGYDLHPEYWGQGFMIEALESLLSFADSKMKIEKISACISVDNIKSKNLVQKLGFLFDGKTEYYSFHGQEYLHNIYTFRIGKQNS